MRGGVVVHQPDERITARNAALVLQFRNATLGDVHEARTIIEPAAARRVAARREGRSDAVDALRSCIARQEGAIEDPLEFGKANAEFHACLVTLAGNQTLQVMTEMLNEIVERSVAEISRSGGAPNDSLQIRRKGIRSQERLVELIALGAGTEAEVHWRTHMENVGQLTIGRSAKCGVLFRRHAHTLNQFHRFFQRQPFASLCHRWNGHASCGRLYRRP